MPPSGLGALDASSRLLVCLSHLRWDLVVQRPHHLLRRAALDFDVVYFEEPVRHAGASTLVQRTDASGVVVVTPHLPHDDADPTRSMRRLLDRLIEAHPHDTLVTWYYTPMALDYAAHLDEDVCVYDCMDELSAFRFAPTALTRREAELFERADVVFTGGRSLYEAKRDRHPNVHCLPSSIDTKHFAKARAAIDDPADQAAIPHPRVGFFGVIDERMDLDLLQLCATAMPQVQFVILGPVVKIDEATLPRGANIHWLGSKQYDDLPAYLGNWDAGWMPFAINDATRFISPTKTPEFLAAGLTVASTPVADVVAGYGRAGHVEIATGEAMVAALTRTLQGMSPRRRRAVDQALAQNSWDRAWQVMRTEIDRIDRSPSTWQSPAAAAPQVRTAAKPAGAGLARAGNTGAKLAGAVSDHV